MFDWVLNTPLNTITNFFHINKRFHIKFNDFLNFFSTSNFFYQYLPKAKTYLEPSRTSTMELFREIFFFFLQNSQENTESLSNKVTDRSPSSEVDARRCSVKKVF